MRYGYLGTMRTRPGGRDEVVRILLSGQDGLRAAGCELYVVGTSETDPDLVWVQEVWRSAEHHQASLELPATRAAIAEAMPLLTGEFHAQEIDVVGGLGLS
ncbi:antibiotic biosynthesis monooxygenase [Actinophytocola xinjiangensis]|uniref:Antibiotic biosynthesis monooxygenase n=1 Tax=Actinophytocola xinjiangensis TaxID=485602 RepID=A0A7Z0WU36_9PSEU|nr:putative quinol monooxygenase [Actinophytocola xinjiangensis]OLF13851.1 antibiotic biosynthesis monooxygenase [Actinophytocola xinjiangensis]